MAHSAPLETAGPAVSFPDGRQRTFSTLAGLDDPRVREMLRRNPKARATVEIVLGEPLS